MPTLEFVDGLLSVISNKPTPVPNVSAAAAAATTAAEEAVNHLPGFFSSLGTFLSAPFSWLPSLPSFSVIPIVGPLYDTIVAHPYFFMGAVGLGFGLWLGNGGRTSSANSSQSIVIHNYPSQPSKKVSIEEPSKTPKIEPKIEIEPEIEPKPEIEPDLEMESRGRSRKRETKKPRREPTPYYLHHRKVTTSTRRSRSRSQTHEGTEEIIETQTYEEERVLAGNLFAHHRSKSRSPCTNGCHLTPHAPQIEALASPNPDQEIPIASSCALIRKRAI